MPVEISGMDELERMLGKFHETTVEALKAAAVQESLNVLTLAIPLTPLDHGTLRRSQFADFPEQVDTAIISRFGFGGAAKRYALYQHEGQRDDGTHVVRNYSESGTGKQYLLRAVDQARPGFEHRVAGHIHRFLEEVLR